MASGERGPRTHQALGDLPGQRAEEFRPADAVLETGGVVRGRVGFGDPLGVLSPYHSKYNRIERCWSALEKKWNDVLLNGLKVVLQCALRMTWKGQHPMVKRLHGAYPDGVRVAAKEMKGYEG